jgi:hypothetical protein
MQHAQVCLGEIPLRLKMRKAQSEVVRELERQLLPPAAPKQRKSATKH